MAFWGFLFCFFSNSSPHCCTARARSKLPEQARTRPSAFQAVCHAAPPLGQRQEWQQEEGSGSLAGVWGAQFNLSQAASWAAVRSLGLVSGSIFWGLGGKPGLCVRKGGLSPCLILLFPSPHCGWGTDGDFCFWGKPRIFFPSVYACVFVQGFSCHLLKLLWDFITRVGSDPGETTVAVSISSVWGVIHVAWTTWANCLLPFTAMEPHGQNA